MRIHLSRTKETIWQQKQKHRTKNTTWRWSDRMVWNIYETSMKLGMKLSQHDLFSEQQLASNHIIVFWTGIPSTVVRGVTLLWTVLFCYQKLDLRYTTICRAQVLSENPGNNWRIPSTAVLWIWKWFEVWNMGMKHALKRKVWNMGMNQEYETRNVS